MRTRKTRGKRLDTGKWVYGSLVYMEKHIVRRWKSKKSGTEDKVIITPICKIYSSDGLQKTTGLQQGKNGEPYKSKQDFIVYEVDPETVGDWAGLEDIEGADIYEDDAVYLAGYGIYIVEFPFTQLYESDAEKDIGGISGNIHDNPALLDTGGE